MAKLRQPSTLANQINTEISAGNNPTAPMAHVPDKSPREQLGDMVKKMNVEQGRDWGTNWASMDGVSPTQSFKRDNTQAYEVNKTQVIPNMPGGEPATVRDREEPDRPEEMSPVYIKGVSNGHKGHTVLRSTLEAMHLLGEHAGNNQKIIESLVNK